jgi:hypothetical protein
MKPEWEDFKKSFEKKVKPKLKGLGFSDGWEIREKLTECLEEAWDQEDELLDAVEDAHEEGVAGKKPEDFMQHSGFKKARGNWDKAIKDHKAQIKALETFCGNAAKQHKELKKLLDPVQKDIKKNKPSRADMKDFAKTLNEAEAALEDLDLASKIYGTLKVAERFYGAKEDQTIASVVKKKMQKISGKDLPKILEESVGKKNVKIAKNMASKVIDMCDEAMEQQKDDPKKSDKTMKNVDKQMKALAKLHSGYKDAAKKQAKDIEKATNAKALKEIIDDIEAFHDSAVEHLTYTRKQLKKAPAA